LHLCNAAFAAGAIRCQECEAEIQVVTRWIFKDQAGIPLAMIPGGEQPNFCSHGQATEFSRRAALAKANPSASAADRAKFLLDDLRCFPLFFEPVLSAFESSEHHNSLVLVILLDSVVDMSKIAESLKRLPIAFKDTSAVEIPATIRTAMRDLFDTKDR